MSTWIVRLLACVAVPGFGHAQSGHYYHTSAKAWEVSGWVPVYGANSVRDYTVTPDHIILLTDRLRKTSLVVMDHENKEVSTIEVNSIPKLGGQSLYITGDTLIYTPDVILDKRYHPKTHVVAKLYFKMAGGTLTHLKTEEIGALRDKQTTYTANGYVIKYMGNKVFVNGKMMISTAQRIYSFQAPFAFYNDRCYLYDLTKGKIQVLTKQEEMTISDTLLEKHKPLIEFFQVHRVNQPAELWLAASFPPASGQRQILYRVTDNNLESMLTDPAPEYGSQFRVIGDKLYARFRVSLPDESPFWCVYRRTFTAVGK